MLGIQKVEWLEKSTEFSTEELFRILDNKSSYIRKLKKVDPTAPLACREVLSVEGDLRTVQDRLLRRVLSPKLKPSECSHGGVTSRSILSYVTPHLGSDFLYQTDIASFYPSISHRKVNALFLRRLRCSPAVARVLTNICTYDFHLALGLVTSPILADQIMMPFDIRISNACSRLGLRYTRYVDDITISGNYSLESSYIRRLVEKSLRELGFRLKRSKDRCCSTDRSEITSLRIRGGNVAVRGSYIEELRRQLLDHKELSKGRELVGHYYSRSQLEGRLYFIRWINRGQAKSLEPLFRSVNWAAAREAADAKRLVPTKVRLVPVEETGEAAES